MVSVNFAGTVRFTEQSIQTEIHERVLVPPIISGIGYVAMFALAFIAFLVVAGIAVLVWALMRE